jgi:hypothetical protein
MSTMLQTHELGCDIFVAGGGPLVFPVQLPPREMVPKLFSVRIVMYLAAMLPVKFVCILSVLMPVAVGGAINHLLQKPARAVS